jgi:DNA polymerase-3 subunit beta
MKISVDRDALLAQLQTAARIASARTAIQALSGAQLSVSSEKCELRSTDMEIGLRMPVPASTVREGTVVLPARLLLDVVRSLPHPEVSLELRAAERDVELISGSAVFHIRTLRNEDFPQFPEPDQEGLISVPAQAFVGTALKVVGSASRDETRPVLTGILISAASGRLEMVATDSYRLSVKQTTLEETLAGDFQVNVPARALHELARIVAHLQTEQLTISVQRNQIVFVLDGAVLSSRLIEGQFPNFRQLLPEGFEHELRIDSAELTGVVRRISLLAQKNRPLRLSFSPGELSVSAETPDVGEARESLPVPFQGEELEIGFNPEFLREGLEAIEEGDVLVKLISPIRPGLIEAADGSGFQYLIMPIRLNV